LAELTGTDCTVLNAEPGPAATAAWLRLCCNHLPWHSCAPHWDLA